MSSQTSNAIITPLKPKEWVSAVPLENYSSLHELSLLPAAGIHLPWPKWHIFFQMSFNLHTPIVAHSDAYLVFQAKDVDPNSASSKSRFHFDSTHCFSFSNLTRWRLDIAEYQCMDGYLKNLIRWHRCNYNKAKKTFSDYGCETTFIDGDWSEHAERAFELYANVAHKHRDWLYDLEFFKTVAKRPDYKLQCVWHKGQLIGICVLQEELPTLHSICLGFDYLHSSACYAYSWMHYTLIEYAINAQKYANIDVGLTADQSKKTIGFHPVPTTLDIYSKGPITRSLLRLFSKFFTATITPAAKLQVNRRKKYPLQPELF